MSNPHSKILTRTNEIRSKLKNIMKDDELDKIAELLDEIDEAVEQWGIPPDEGDEGFH